MVKICTSCKIEKPIDAFAKASKASGSLFGVKSCCKECTNRKDKERRISDPEFREKERLRSLEKDRRDRLENPEKLARRWRKYAKLNHDKVKAANRSWYSRNREQQRNRVLQWCKNNPDGAKRLSEKRVEAFSTATPKWLTAIQKAQIREFYDVAKALSVQTGEKHNVDHVFALRGDGFDGLHVPWNLQILTAEQNAQKHNRVSPEHAHLLWSSH